MEDSFLAEGFLLAKKIGLGQPKRLENAKILVANTPMDTDKIKVCLVLDTQAVVRCSRRGGLQEEAQGGPDQAGGGGGGWA